MRTVCLNCAREHPLNCEDAAVQTIHVTFINGEFNGASVVRGSVRQVAEDTVRDIVERQGHPTKRVSTTWPIDDSAYWREVVYEGTVTLEDGYAAEWRHIFTTARDPWPTISVPLGEAS